MSEVRIVTHIEEGGWGDDRVHQEFFVNGSKVGFGYYGGEPEDNSYYRDYGWVDDVIINIARELGADVIEETITEDELNY